MQFFSRGDSFCPTSGVQFKEGLPQKLYNLQPKDVVEVKGLSQDYARMFIASELSVPDTQKELDFKDAWTEETIKSVMAQGSQRCWRGAALGNVCYANPVSPFRARMRDNTMLALKDSQFPPDVEEVLVRIIYINENNDVLCEFISTVR